MRYLLQCMLFFGVLIGSLFAQQIPEELQNMSPAEISKLKKQYQNMSPAERSQLKEQYQNMSPAERSQLKKQYNMGTLEDRASNEEGNPTIREFADLDAVAKYKYTSPLPVTNSAKLAPMRFATKQFTLSDPKLFAATSNQVDPTYPLKFGDKLILSIWGGPDEEHQLVIDRSGNVLVPNIGRLSLNGLTLYQAEKLIKRNLRLTNPGVDIGSSEVSLRVQELSSIKVYVLGNAMKPSAYVIQGNSSVLTALYFAGGPNSIGSVRNIELKRGRKTIKIDLYDYLIHGKVSKNYSLRDGDIIHIPAATKLVEIKGAVNKPAIFEIINEEDMEDVISFAQGIKVEASNFYSIRRRPTKEDVVQLDFDNLSDVLSKKIKNELKHGDIISIKSNPRTVEEFVSITGRVNLPNQFSFQAGMNLSNLIEIAGGALDDAHIEAVQIYSQSPDQTYTLTYEGGDLNTKLSNLDSVFIPSLSDTVLNTNVSISGAVKKKIVMKYIPGVTAKTLYLKSGGGTEKWKKGSFIIERLTKDDQIEIKKIELDTNLYLQELGKIRLRPRDRIFLTINTDYYLPELITIGGPALLNPGKYPLIIKGEKLLDFINRVAQTSPTIQWSAVRFYRLRNGKEYSINLDFTEVIKGGKGSDISLKSGDRIKFEDKKYTIQVTGEVISPGDVLWQEGLDVEDYLEIAGGLTRFGDEDRVIVVLSNGVKSNADNLEDAITPGSQIVVSFKPEDPPIEWSTVIQGSLTVVGAIASIILTIVLIDDKLGS